jgi:hypothetical protein
MTITTKFTAMGLIDDIPTVRDLVARIVEEAGADQRPPGRHG